MSRQDAVDPAKDGASVSSYPSAEEAHQSGAYPELQQAYLRAESKAARYSVLYDFAPSAYLTANPEGVILSANRSAIEILGLPASQLTGFSLFDLVADEMRMECSDFLARTLKTDTRQVTELRLKHTRRGGFYARVEANSDCRGQVCRLIIIDITDRQRAERALADSEERFRLMADSAPVLIWIAGPDQRYLWFNQMWLNFTGRTLAQELGGGWTQGLHPDDYETCMSVQACAFHTQHPFSMEYRLRSQDGHYHYMLAHGVPRTSPSGKFLGYIGSCTDITERKKVEEALRHSRQMLRHLVSYQERVREDERKRIAREIHDDLGQNLLALRIDVSMLHARTANSHPKLNERVHSALNHIDATMKAVRAAINNLRPTVLDLGLNAAIEWQVQDFQRRSGIECELTMEHDFYLDDTHATALFRILQESLNNIIRHAKASQVWISLIGDRNNLVMTISDDGIGMYPDCRRKANSFGLVGIEERINALGGEFHVDSNPNRGTTLMISLPVQNP